MILPILPLTAMLMQTPAEQSAIDRVHLDLQYDHEWYTYLMKELGCPMGVPVTAPKEQCTLPRQVDVGAFGRARKLAMRVFDLEEKR